MSVHQPNPLPAPSSSRCPGEATLAARWSLWRRPPAGAPGLVAWIRGTGPFFLPALRGLSASYSARGLLAWYLLVPSRAVSILEQVTGEKTLCFSGRTMWSIPLPPVPRRGSQPFVGRVLTVAFRRLPALGVGLPLSSSAGADTALGQSDLFYVLQALGCVSFGRISGSLILYLANFLTFSRKGRKFWRNPQAQGERSGIHGSPPHTTSCQQEQMCAVAQGVLVGMLDPWEPLHCPHPSILPLRGD